MNYYAIVTMSKTAFFVRRQVVFFSLTFFFVNSQQLSAQRNIDWNILADVQFEEKFDKETEAYWLTPEFGKTVQSYENQTVVIEGYLIQMGIIENIYILSKYPYSSCFFCGGAGPESVIELKLNKEVNESRIDKRVRIQGRLVLNATDYEQLNYILDDAQLSDNN